MQKRSVNIGILFSLFVAHYSLSLAQNLVEQGQLHGNFQTDLQFYNSDSVIGAPEVPEKMLMSSFTNLTYTNGKISVGLRYESYLNVLQGFDPRYEDMGIPYRYLTFNDDKIEITAGNYYEQFGSGLILRTYENWGLGYDNSLDGIRIKSTLFNGLYLKGIIGKQRYFFDHGTGIVRGFDGEINFNELISKLSDSRFRIIVGGGLVSKYQSDKDPIYILPENVAAAAGRLNLIKGFFNFYGEYAFKINDPSTVNGYIYKPGNALLLQSTYSKKGIGISLSAKRVDNMSYKSDRAATGFVLDINYLAASTKQHTYSLAAMYPYATQPNGEIGFQGEIIYTIPKKSKLGGKYGTTFTLNYSRVNSLATSDLPDSTYMGYTSDFLSIGNEIYYQEISTELYKKINKKLKGTLMYLYQQYNQGVVTGIPDRGTIYSHIGIVDFSYKFSLKKTLRIELQSLNTKQDSGSWAMVLAEYSIAPHWYFAAMDQYNYGNQNNKKVHYYLFSSGYTFNHTRISVGYGRQRAGIFCVGGVCRNVPASNGFTLSVTSNF